MMTTMSRRAPRLVKTFLVLETFRYERRVYQAGDVFVPRSGIPRMRLDRFWRAGYIGTHDGEVCPTVVIPED